MFICQSCSPSQNPTPVHVVASIAVVGLATLQLESQAASASHTPPSFAKMHTILSTGPVCRTAATEPQSTILGYRDHFLNNPAVVLLATRASVTSHCAHPEIARKPPFSPLQVCWTRVLKEATFVGKQMLHENHTIHQ
jgi:hypothetical protein